MFMRPIAAALAAAALAAPALAEPVAYEVDPTHSQIVFHWDHAGFSSTFGAYSAFSGEITFDEADPASSSVEVTIPTDSLYTGLEDRKEHMLSPDMLDAAAHPEIGFTSTAIEVTGDDTATITGELTVHGQTQTVALDARMTKMGAGPSGDEGHLGFMATTTLKRSDFGVDFATPATGADLRFRGKDAAPLRARGALPGSAVGRRAGPRTPRS